MRVRYHLKDFLPHRVQVQKLSAVVLALLWLSAGTLLAQPAAPTQVWPANNATSIAISPTLSWSSVTGATSYELQVSVNSNMSSPVVNATGITATSKQATGLSAETIYYWRVRAKNASGTSAYSSIRKFTVTGPEWYTQPYVLTSPNFPGEYPIDYDYTWTINARQGATKVRAHFSDFNIYNAWYGRSDTVYVQNPSATTTYKYYGSNFTAFTSIDIPGNVLVVRFRTDHYGASSGWKMDYYQYYGIFPETGEALAGPAIVSPTNGATGISTTPVLSWNSVTNGAEYEEYDVQVSTASDFSTAVVKDSNITSTTYSVSGLLGSTQYYWRVRAKTTIGTSSYTVGSFTTQVGAPVAPTLSSPSNNATGISTSPTLNWNASATATAYDVQVATDAGFSSVVKSATDVASTSTQVTGLSNSTKYYWCVRAKNTAGTSSYSSGWNFTTQAPTVPSAPTLSSPGNNATGVSTAPTLSWNSVSGATGYELQVSTSSNFTTTVVNQTNLTGTSHVASGLSTGTLYFWRVLAKNGAGSSSYSSTWSFTTQSGAPATPTLASPSNGATGVSTAPTLSWNAVAGATTYELQVSTSSGFTATVVDQTNLTAATYQASGLSPLTVHYWRVLAKNTAGSSSYSATWSFTTNSNVQVAISAQKVSVILNSPSQSTDYRLFSVPGNLNAISVSAQTSGVLKIGDIFTGTQKTDWRVFNDNGNATDYLVELGPENLFSIGRGVWAAKRGGLTVPTLSSQHTVASDKTVTISVLANTWNIIGNPFDESVSWSTVMSANTGLTDGLWEYKGSSGFTKATTMEPFKGYYYKTGVGKTSIKIPYPVAGVTSLPASIAALPIDWQLKLSLETALNKDQENMIGIAPSAKAGMDALDAAKPPLVFDQGFLYFNRPDWDGNYPNFASDFRPSLSDGQTWSFEVRNPQKGTTTIRVSGIESLPQDCEVLLINPANSTPHDLRANAAYTYETLTEKMTFKIIVGKRSFVESELSKEKPGKFALSQNYPNPFNPTTVIGFQIAKEAMVKLEIFNMLGQKVRTLVNERLSPASYSKFWDGRDASGQSVASGMYFYRLAADSKLIETKKMILTK